jgi:hypothetical protein
VSAYKCIELSPIELSKYTLLNLIEMKNFGGHSMQNIFPVNRDVFTEKKIKKKHEKRALFYSFLEKGSHIYVNYVK